MNSIFDQIVAGVDWWSFVAGLGLFLLAMKHIEDAMRMLAGGRIKRFLREHTDRPIESIGSGVLATSLLQSSSLVGLLILAMVGANVIALQNALGVIIGANLGTTLTGWLVAIFGFKMDLTHLALPLLAAGSIGQITLNDENQYSPAFKLVTGIGLLLFGLDFMKSSVTTEHFQLTGFSPLTFLLAGIALTAIIQSSSAAMMIALAALHANAITLPDGAAFVIGADLGTTSTVLLGAIKGSADKRRVGLAHFIFNLIINMIAFFILLPYLPKAIQYIPTNEPLYLLVAFHSVFNLLGVFLFYPVLSQFAQFLERFFVSKDQGLAISLTSTVAADVDSALTAMHNELNHLMRRVLSFNRQTLKHNSSTNNRPTNNEYHNIKTIESELLSFGITVQKQKMDDNESTQLESLITTARNLVHSAKSMHDSGHDLRHMEESLDAQERELFENFSTLGLEFYTKAEKLMNIADAPANLTDLCELQNLNYENHEKLHRKIFENLNSSKSEWDIVSSYLNANREHYISNNDFVDALANMKLSKADQTTLRNNPVNRNINFTL